MGLTSKGQGIRKPEPVEYLCENMPLPPLKNKYFLYYLDITDIHDTFSAALCQSFLQGRLCNEVIY